MYTRSKNRYGCSQRFVFSTLSWWVDSRRCHRQHVIFALLTCCVSTVRPVWAGAVPEVTVNRQRLLFARFFSSACLVVEQEKDPWYGQVCTITGVLASLEEVIQLSFPIQWDPLPMHPTIGGGHWLRCVLRGHSYHAEWVREFSLVIVRKFGPGSTLFVSPFWQPCWDDRQRTQYHQVRPLKCQHRYDSRVHFESW